MDSLSAQSIETSLPIPDDKDLEAANIYADSAVRAAPQLSYADTVLRLSRLCVVLFKRCERQGDANYLQKAVSISMKLAQQVSSPHPHRVRMMLNLRNYIKYKSDRTLSATDADEEINIGLQILKEMALNEPERGHHTAIHPSRVGLSHDVAAALLTRSETTGSKKDLEKGLKLIQSALSIQLNLMDAYQDENMVSALFEGQSKIYAAKYQQTGLQDDLKNALESARHAKSTCPIGAPKRPDVLVNLSTVLLYEFERTGATTALNEAIQAAKDIVYAGPTNSTPGSIERNNLGHCLYQRYRLLGASEDLEEAISESRKSLSPIVIEDRRKTAHLYVNLGNQLLLSQLRLRSPRDSSDVDEAVRIFKLGLGAAISDRQRQDLLGSLGLAYNIRYRGTRQLCDLNEAINVTRKALENATKNQRARFLNNLALSLWDRSRQLKKLEDLKEAVTFFNEAVNATEKDSPDYARRLLNLADAMNHHTQMLLSHPTAITTLDTFPLFLRVWESPTASLANRISAAKPLMMLLLAQNQKQKASSLLDEVVRLIPKLSPSFLRRQDQQRVLGSIRGVTAHACSVALEVGKGAAVALALLELGRGVIMGNVIDTRNDVSKLAEKWPHLYTLFEQLRSALDPAISVLEENMFGAPALQNRLDSAQKLEELLKEVRSKEGFETFQLPPSAEELMHMAEQGPIVVLNTTTIRSDAIIVRRSRIDWLALPDLHESDIKKWEDFMMEGLLTHSISLVAYAKKNKELRKMLKWLWNSTAELVLQKLGFKPATFPDNLPRIWWVGVGPLSKFPFHAAGYHGFGSSRNVTSHAISSYTATIKALAYSRENPWTLTSNKTSTKLLLVTMASTPGMGSKWDLRGVEDEAKVIHDLSTTAGVVVKSERVAKTVLQDMQTHDIIHCACHGLSDPTDPSESGLVLSADSQGTECSTLTVSDVARIKTRTQLAYLSACRTADHAHTKLEDEVIHVASGFQLSGIRHVVGTLWEVDDEVSVSVAREFYQAVFSHLGEEVTAFGVVAEALHKAVWHVRKEAPKDVLRWVPFVNFGA